MSQMQCEKCGIEINNEFGPEKDFCIYCTVQYLDESRTKYRTIKHAVCLPCYRSILGRTEERDTKLT